MMKNAELLEPGVKELLHICHKKPERLFNQFKLGYFREIEFRDNLRHVKVGYNGFTITELSADAVEKKNVRAILRFYNLLEVAISTEFVSSDQPAWLFEKKNELLENQSVIDLIINVEPMPLLELPIKRIRRQRFQRKASAHEPAAISLFYEFITLEQMLRSNADLSLFLTHLTSSAKLTYESDAIEDYGRTYLPDIEFIVNELSSKEYVRSLFVSRRSIKKEDVEWRIRRHLTMGYFHFLNFINELGELIGRAPVGIASIMRMYFYVMKQHSSAISSLIETTARFAKDNLVREKGFDAFIVEGLSDENDIAQARLRESFENIVRDDLEEDVAIVELPVDGPFVVA
jgi:hypothetical protein